MEEQRNIETSGFVVLPRLSLKNLRDKLLFYHLLEQADWNTGEVRVNVSELERETNWTRREITYSLNRLITEGLITKETLRQKRGVLVTITDYRAFQSLSHYKKSKKIVQENVHENEQETVQEVVQGNDSANPYGIRDEQTVNDSLVQENEQRNVQEDAQENVHLLFNNSIINSNSNSNINNKPNTSLVSEKTVLASEKDVELFVDENIDVLPSGVSRKLLIRYCETIRLTRNTCKISRNVLLQVFTKMRKYTSNQINYAIWNHAEKHDDKREKYTLGILRNTSNDEAYRKLMLMLNRMDDLIEGGEENGLYTRKGKQEAQRAQEHSRYSSGDSDSIAKGRTGWLRRPSTV